jgi:hypothetical protein
MIDLAFCMMLLIRFVVRSGDPGLCDDRRSGPARNRHWSQGPVPVPWTQRQAQPMRSVDITMLS